MIVVKNHIEFPKLKLGVSQCLLGEKVRFDGGHKRFNFVVNELQPFVDFISVCPEVGAGLGIPRPPIQLNKSSGNIRIVEIKNKDNDVTDALKAYSNQVVGTFSELHGFIVKSKSPSCGLERVNIMNAKGQYEKKGVGIFTKELMERYPNLPIEEEGRLNDAAIRENFITRIYAYQRWHQFLEDTPSLSTLIEFHQNHKLLLMAHNVNAYRRLGRLVAETTLGNLQQNIIQYINEFMGALRFKATLKKHTNVLQHLTGYLKKESSKADKQELVEIIEQYRLGLIPLIVPMTLLKHYFRIHPNEYIANQVYLNPHPNELMLRNHV